LLPRSYEKSITWNNNAIHFEENSALFLNKYEISTGKEHVKEFLSLK
jgi:hypothetical protein